MKRALTLLLLTCLALCVAIGLTACGGGDSSDMDEATPTNEYYYIFDGDDSRTKASLGDTITLPTTADGGEGQELIGWEIGKQTYAPGESITLESFMFYQCGNENGVNIYELDCRPIFDEVKRSVYLHYFGDKTIEWGENSLTALSVEEAINPFCLSNTDLEWKTGNRIDTSWLFLDKYDFEGWYLDKEYTKEYWDYSDLDLKNSGKEVHLYAKWTYTGIVFEEYDAARWRVAEIDLSKDIDKLVIPSTYGRGKRCDQEHIGYEINGILSDAFKGDGKIGTLVLQEGIELEAEAFSGLSIDCISLNKVALPDRYTNIFDGYNGILSCSADSDYEFLDGILYSKTSNEIIWVSKHIPAEITLRDGVTSIGSYFAGANIKQITLPNTVEYLGEYAFKNCSELERVLANSLVGVAQNAFDGCSAFEYEIYNGGKYIGNFLMGVVEGATSLEVKEGCTAIPTAILENNETVKRVVLPSSIKTINNDAFKNSAIEEIVMSGTEVYLGYNAFEGCASLRTVVMPESTRFIGSSCFRKCVSLESIDLSGLYNDEPDVVALDSSAFAGCTMLSTVIMSDKINAIESACFMNCSSLVEIILPESIVRLGESCFAYCVSLSSVSIPAVEVLGTNCFVSCQSLSRIILPSTLSKIGGDCFSDCESLEYIFYCDSYDKWASIENDGNEIEGRLYFYSAEEQTVEDYLQTGIALWRYDENNNPKIWNVETNSLVGKTFEISNISVEVSDFYWDLIVQIKDAGMLEDAFGSDIDMYNAVNNATTKNDLNENIAVYYMSQYGSHKMEFEDGYFISYQNGQLAGQMDYVELNGEIAYLLENGLSYSIVSDSQIKEVQHAPEISNNDTITITIYYSLAA